MYLHESVYISSQNTFPDMDLETLNPSFENKLTVKEPSYPGIPSSILRRMGKAVRYGVGCALPLLELKKDLHGIIIGTGHGGMEDCIKFLNQIIEYEEGTLTPTNFVQSTPNAIASQLGMMSENTGHNSTHVHSGLAFENAMLEAVMLLKEFPTHSYLLGGVEEISTYQYNIERLGGWHKKEKCSNINLYDSNTEGSLAGEGAAMFLVNSIKENAVAKVTEPLFFETADLIIVKARLKDFIKRYSLPPGTMLLTGENGDIRFNNFYQALEEELQGLPIVRFKHFTGEYSSVTSAALWLCMQILTNQNVPAHMIKTGKIEKVDTILIYNCHKGIQHSFTMVTKS